MWWWLARQVGLLALAAALAPIIIVAIKLGTAYVRYLRLRGHYRDLPRLIDGVEMPSLKIYDKGGYQDVYPRYISLAESRPDGKLPPFVHFGANFNGNILLHAVRPEAIKVIANDIKTFPKFQVVYDAVEPLIGRGLVLSGGLRWHTTRKLLTPLFHFSHLADMSAIMCTEARDFLSKIEADFTTGYHDAFDVFSLITLRIIVATTFGDAFDVEWMQHKWHAAAEAYMKYALGHMLLGKLWKYVPVHQSRGLRMIMADIEARINEVMDERRASFEKDPSAADASCDLLSRMLAAQREDGSKMTKKEIQDECLTFLFAGHDTTANLLSWTCHFITVHPDVQAKLIAEVDDVVGRDRDVELSDVANFRYMKMVFNETLRLAPPATTLDRIVAEDTEVCGQRLVKGTVVGLAYHGAHLDPGTWDAPLEYRPERFTKEGMDKRHPYAFAPFSVGPRNCIGKRFALQEAALIFATILQRYRIVADPTRTAYGTFVTTYTCKDNFIRFVAR